MVNAQNSFYQQLKDAGLVYEESLAEIEVGKELIDLIPPE